MQEQETKMPNPTPTRRAAADVFGGEEPFVTLRLSKREAYAVSGLLTLGIVLARNPQAVLMTDDPSVATHAAAVTAGFSSHKAVLEAVEKAGDEKPITKRIQEGVRLALPISTGLLARLLSDPALKGDVQAA